MATTKFSKMKVHDKKMRVKLQSALHVMIAAYHLRHPEKQTNMSQLSIICALV